MKLTDSGELIWVKQLTAGDIRNMKHDLNGSGDIFLSGGFNSTIDLDPGDIALLAETEGNMDIFIVKLDSNGNFIWGKTIGGFYKDFSEDIVITAAGEIISKGRFDRTVDFDPGDETYNVTRDSEDSSSYILKFEDCDPLVSIDSITQCDYYTWINGITYTTDRSVAIVETNEVGCDSIYYLYYDRLPYTYETDIVESCNPYLWIDGIIYANDTVVTLTYENIYGCDSTLRFEFDYIEPFLTEDSVHTCVPYTWMDGMTYYADTIVSDTIINPIGCDTLVTLNINLYDTMAVTNTVTSCLSYTWIDGHTYYRDTMVITIIENPSSCDTLVTLNLEVISISTTLTVFADYMQAKELGAIYTWLDCDDGFSVVFGETSDTFYPEESGNYAVIIEKDGCIDTSDCYNYLIDESSISKNDLNYIAIYPNPGTGHFTLSLPANQNLTIEFMDLHGKLIQHFNQINSTQFEFDLDASSGIYHVVVTSKTYTQSLKLIQL